MTAPTPLNLIYQDPDGNTWPLSDYSMSLGYVCSGIAGIEGFPVTMQTIPMLDGTAVPNIYLPQPGSISLAVLIGHPNDDDNAYYRLLDQFVRAFMTRRNELPKPGYLQVQRPDGSIRQIAVYTTAGLDSPEAHIHYTLYTLTLQTPDPYWQDLVSQTVVFANTSAAGILPLLPVALTGQLIGGGSLINTGSGLAYPIWTITGPGTPTITNVTTGRQWSLNAPIPAGNVVQVTTQPGQQYVVNQTTATNIWDSLVLSSLRDLWPLVGGTNQVNIAMAGSSAATSVQVQWTNRWQRA